MASSRSAAELLQPCRWIDLGEKQPSFDHHVWQFLCYGLPDYPCVDDVVTVGNDITKVNDPTTFGDSIGHLWFDRDQPSHRLAKYLELAFDSGPQLKIRLKVLDCFAGDKRPYR